MNQKMFNTLENRLRNSIFTNKELSDMEIMFAIEYISTFMAPNVYSGAVKLTIPQTWNIKLYAKYTVLRDMLQDTRSLSVESNERLVAILRMVFVIKSLQKKNENQYLWIADHVSDYYKECFLNKTQDEKTLFKSKNISIKLDPLSKSVRLIEHKSRMISVKFFELSELNLFYGMKDFVKSKFK